VPGNSAIPSLAGTCLGTGTGIIGFSVCVTGFVWFIVFPSPRDCDAPGTGLFTCEEPLAGKSKYTTLTEQNNILFTWYMETPFRSREFFYLFCAFYVLVSCSSSSYAPNRKYMSTLYCKSMSRFLGGKFLPRPAVQTPIFSLFIAN
jgi:hypothetical protein